MKLTIRNKLFLSFGLIVLMVMGFGVYSILVMNNIASGSSDVINRSFTKLDYAYSARATIAEYRGREYRHVSLRSLNEMKAIEEEMTEMENEVKSHIEEYKKIVIDEKDKKLVDELENVVDEYIAVNQKILSL